MPAKSNIPAAPAEETKDQTSLLDNPPPSAEGAASGKIEELPDPPAKVKGQTEPPPQPNEFATNADGVQTSTDVKDPGTPERHKQGTSLDDTPGAGQVVGVVGSLDKDIAVTERGIAKVWRNQSTLDLLLKNKTIDQEQHDAGVKFERTHLMSNRYSLRAVSYDAVKASMSREDFLAVQIEASRRIKEWIDLLGGDNAPAAVALVYILGKGGTINDLWTYTGRTAPYWRGAIVQGLSVLAAHLLRGEGKGKRGAKKAGNQSSQ